VIIGHRGSPATDPENSLQGFRTAIDAGVQAVEFDVRLTRDDVLVCSHDPALGRLGGARVPIAQLTLEQVQGQTLKGGATVPTLQDVLGVCYGRIDVVVEVKNKPTQPDFRADRRSALVLADFLQGRRRQGITDRVRAVSSFDGDSVSLFAQAAPEYADRTALLGIPTEPPEDILEEAERRGLGHIHLHYLTLLRKQSIVARAAERGVQVTAWTVNSRPLARRFLGLGVVGIVTDDPRRLLDLVPLAV
jgi:glycerophosphoryl diester phosphodiesterase